MTQKMAVLLTLFFAISAYANGLNTIHNDAGKVIYLELNQASDLELLFRDNPDIDCSHLKTLIISDMSKLKEVKKYLDPLYEFIATRVPNLKHLYFDDGDFEFQHLHKILLAAKDLPLKKFSWTSQEEIDDDDLMPAFMAEAGPVLVKIAELDFSDTEFDEDSFFLGQLRFEALQVLKINAVLNDAELFNALFSDLSNFPMLEELHMDNSDISRMNRIKQTTGELNNLRYLSIYNTNYSTSEILILLNKIGTILSNIERFNIHSERADDEIHGADGVFMRKPGDIIRGNDLGLIFKINLARNARKASAFTVFDPDTTKIDRYFADVATEPGLIFTHSADVKTFYEYYPGSQRSSIILADANIGFGSVQSVLETVADQTKITDIFLISTVVQNTEIRQLRTMSSALNIRLHMIDSAGSGLRSIGVFMDNIMMQQHMQHMLQMQMQQNIQQNIPKMR
jgi:hypothetical protein